MKTNLLCTWWTSVTQSGITDCGLYATAIMSSLALGKDPYGIVFKKEEDFRARDCWEREDNRISVFPKAQGKIKDTTDRSVWCTLHLQNALMMDQRWCVVILAINGFILLVLNILIVEINGNVLCAVMRNHNWHLYHMILTTMQLEVLISVLT